VLGRLGRGTLTVMDEQEVLSAAVLELVPAREGHIRLESGHHSNLWLDLELLCFRPARIERFATDLAGKLAAYHVDMVCGPLNEGAFVALMVAARLDVGFTYSEQLIDTPANSLYSVGYRLPGPLREVVHGKRVAIVNDVISAGSAVRGTLADLRDCGAQIVAIGALLTLGELFGPFAAQERVPLISLAALAYPIWAPAECPLCAAGIPLT
jgi:orotate phosphoribosyltransferase